MSLLTSIFLGILQGITEFLPISSSGHLVIFEKILNLPVYDLKSFDIILHLGTLIAIIVYFRQDFLTLLKRDNRKFLIYLIIGTIPAIIFGGLFNDKIDELFRNIQTISITMLLVGVFLLIAESKFFKKEGEVNSITKAIIIGLAQALALIPGVSRSGATISTSLVLGVKRTEAARFSFLLGSIAISCAGAYSAVKYSLNGEVLQPLSVYFAGFISSLISSFFAIKFIMKFLQNHSLKIFAYYRIILSVGIISYLVIRNF